MIPDHAYQTAIDRLRHAESVILTTHVKPDADGLGSVLALALWLQREGKTVRIIVPTAPPEKYAFLDPAGVVEVAGRDAKIPAIPQADLVVVVDTCTWQQLEGMEPLVAEAGAEVLVIDHHQTRDAVASLELIDPTAPLRQAADLVAAGAVPWDIHARMNQSDSLSKVRLWGLAVATLHPALDGRVTVMHVTRAMFREAGAGPGDTENLINVCLQVRGILAGVMLVEADPGEIRLSLRCVPGVNVLQVAEAFGGGGHIRAAGARLEGTIADVEARVLKALEPILAEAVAAQTPPTHSRSS